MTVSVEDEGQVNRDAYPALSCSLSAMSCALFCGMMSGMIFRLLKG